MHQETEIDEIGKKFSGPIKKIQVYQVYTPEFDEQNEHKIRRHFLYTNLLPLEHYISSKVLMKDFLPFNTHIMVPRLKFRNK